MKILQAAQFVTRMLRIFGVCESEEIGMGAGGGGNVEEVPFVFHFHLLCFLRC